MHITKLNNKEKTKSEFSITFPELIHFYLFLSSEVKILSHKLPDFPVDFLSSKIYFFVWSMILWANE